MTKKAHLAIQLAALLVAATASAENYFAFSSHSCAIVDYDGEMLSFNKADKGNNGTGGYYYDNSGGSGLTDMNIGEGEDSIEAQDKAGYRFLGWYTKSSGWSNSDWPTVAGATDLLVSSKTLTYSDIIRAGKLNNDRRVVVAKYIPVYTITTGVSPADTGTATGAGTYDEGANVSLVATPNTGYEFSRWEKGGATVSTSATCSFAAESGCAGAYTAVFTGQCFEVTFNANGGEGGTLSVLATFGSAMPTLTSLPERYGYDFAGYFDGTGSGANKYYDASGSSARNWDKAQTADLYAKWDPQMGDLRLRFPKAGVKSIRYRIGESSTWTTKTADADIPLQVGTMVHAYAEPADAYSVDYDIENQWTNSIPRDGITFKPAAEADCVVTFVDPSGSNATVKKVVKNGGSVIPPDWSRTGYVLGGWGGYDFSSVTESITASAVWTPVKYYVCFDANGGSGPGINKVTANYDEAIAMPANTFTRAGYEFAGWATTPDGEALADGEFVNLASEAGATATLYALWRSGEYKVRFDANGGAGEMEDIEVAYDTAFTLPPCKFSLEGHAFAGWATNGTDKVVYEDGATVSNLTAGGVALLRAVWNEIRYTIRFRANGGTTNSPMNDVEDVKYGEAVMLPSNTFTRVGSKFEGWALSADGGKVYDDCETVSNLTTVADGIVKLYAHWTGSSTANKYSIAADCATSLGNVLALELEAKTFINFHQEEIDRTNGCRVVSNDKDGAYLGDEYIKLVMPDGAFDSSSELSFGAKVNGSLTFWYQIDLVEESNSGSFIVRDNDGNVDKLYVDYSVSEWTNSDCIPLQKDHTYKLVFESLNKDDSYVLIDKITFTADDGQIPEGDTVPTVTVSFDANGGDSISFVSKKLEYDDRIDEFPTATRDGYNLDGWYTEADGGTKVTVATRVKENVTYYAHWTEVPPEPPEELKDLGVVVGGYTNKYDGAAHGISVNVTKAVGVAVTKRFATSEGGKFDSKEPTFTDAGTNTVWCVVSATGYAVTTNSATVVILPREVTLTSGNAEKEYDGTALTNSQVTVGGDGFADGEGATFNVTGSQTEIGSSSNKFTYAFNAGTKPGNYDVSTVFGTLTVTEFSPVGVVVKGYAGKYDGSAHGISVEGTNGVDGVAVMFATSKGGEFGKDEPTFADAGTYTVWCESSAPGYATTTNLADVVILPRDVTLTSGSAEKVYDGTPVLCADVYVGGDGFADGEGATFDVTGSQTDVGESANTFTYELNDGTRAENYNVTTNCGTLKVTKGEDPEPPPAPPVVAGEGTVTIPKRWKANQKVTWKAKAAKGSVFAHWEGDFVESLELSTNELRSPSLQFVADEASGDFDTNRIQAVFIALDSDKLSTLSLSSFEPLALNEKVAEFVLQDDSESYVTATVSGLPSGLKFDKKTLAITGTPKKSGAFIVKITAKNASGYQWAENVVLKVKNADGTVPPDPAVVPVPKRTMYHPLTVMSSDVADGTVTGTGVYAAGKKVSISARAAKEHVFAGWYRDKELTEPMEFASGDYLKSPQSVVIPEARYLYAWFVTTVQDRDSIKFFVNDEECLTTAMPPVSNWCGVAVNWPIEATALSATTVKASGLPAGVKLVQDKTTKAYSLSGAPTSASRKDKYGDLTPSKVKLTVTTAGKSSKVYEFNWTIMPLPNWTVGTFNGAVFGEDDSPTGLVQTLTVAANGKISGKVLYDGLTWTLAAPCFDGLDSLENPAFHATVVAKSGKLVATNAIEIAVDDSVDFERGVVAGTFNGQLTTHNSQLTTYTWTAYQNLWKAESWKKVAKPFGKAPALGIDDGVSLKFATSGAVTAKGVFKSYSASCSTVLIPNDDETYSVYLHFPMKSGKFDGYSAEVGLLWNGESFSEAKE